MIDWLATIPPSIILAVGSVIVAGIGALFSYKQSNASAAKEITEASKFIMDEYKERMERLENDAVQAKLIYEQESAQARRTNQKLAARVSSLEHNEIENGKWIESLEGMHEKLQGEHKELKQQYDDLLERYRKLQQQVEQVESDSSPHLRAEE